jgi:hypothetical protein
VILEYGDVAKVKGLNWYMLELRSEKTVESTLRRMGKALHGIFRTDPIEIFIPVIHRDLDSFDLSTGPYLFVRSNNFSSLLRLKSITGCVSLVTEGDTNRPSKAITVEDSYVQGLISEAEERHRKQIIGIEVGSFVRVLNGPTRDYCGIVEIIGDGRAVVRIILCTKSILLETPVRNLLNLSHVPKDQRVYYYSPLVVDLFKDNPDASVMIEEDLRLDEPVPTAEQATTPVEELLPKKHSRQRTVTALVKKLILIEGLHNPMEIAKRVVAALKSDEIKAPKNLFICYCIIKDQLRMNYFSKIDKDIGSYRDIIRKYGKEYKFSANQIAKLDRDLKIPINTVDVCKDGRSREARQKSGKKVLHIKKLKKEKLKKKKKDKCGECFHDRKSHKITSKGTWMRCTDFASPAIHSWIKKAEPCWCKRFREKKK